MPTIYGELQAKDGKPVRFGQGKVEPFTHRQLCWLAQVLRHTQQGWNLTFDMAGVWHQPRRFVSRNA